MQLQCNFNVISCANAVHILAQQNTTVNWLPMQKKIQTDCPQKFRAANGLVFSTLGRKSKAEYPFLQILQIVWTSALCCRKQKTTLLTVSGLTYLDYCNFVSGFRSRMNNSANDEIFYSDDEFSDGESTVQVKLNPNFLSLWKCSK